MSDWPTVMVAELQSEGVLLVEDGNHGEYRPRPDEFIEGGTAFIRAADLSEGRVRFDAAGGINDVALARIRKGIGRPGDVLFSHKGTVGKLARVPPGAPAFVCSPQTTFWRVLDESRLLRDYLYAYMRSRRFVDQWWARKGETDMADYVSLTAQRQLRVVVPPLEVQRRIAGPLTSIDDLIENNRRRVEVLEEMARAIYLEWFVRFRYPGHDAVRLVESQLGQIPDGWKVAPIGELFQVVLGGTPSRNKPEYWTAGTVPWVTSTRVNDLRVLEPSELITVDALDSCNAKVMPKRATLVAITGATLGQVSALEIEACANQSVVGVFDPGEAFAEYLYLWFSANIGSIISHASGSAQQHINKGTVASTRILLPPPHIVDHFRPLVGPMFDLIADLLRGEELLSTMRDLLLPKLVTGQIDVSHLDLDALTEAAAG